MNLVALTGRLVQDPEIIKASMSIANFVLAVPRDYKTKDQDTDFIKCTAYRSVADYIGNYIRKGDLVSITGRLQTRQYVDKDKTKKTVCETIIDKIKVEYKKVNQEQIVKEVTQYNKFEDTIDVQDEDIPF